MNPDKWNIFLSLQGDDENSIPPDPSIVQPLEEVETRLLRYDTFGFFSPYYSYKNILIIGSGSGGENVIFSKFGYQTEGTVIHHSSKKYADLIYNINLHVDDMHDSKLLSESFDGIYTHHTLEHALAPFVAVFEMWRLLKQNGKLLMIVPNIGDDEEIGLQHYSVLRKVHWEHLLKLIGFDIIESFISNDAHNNIVIKAIKSDKDAAGKHFKLLLEKKNLY